MNSPQIHLNNSSQITQKTLTTFKSNKMGENLPIIAKKFWKIIRVMYFMARTGISKGKLLADLNVMLKRAKIAGKLATIHNLMFHLHNPFPVNEYGSKCKRSNVPPPNEDVFIFEMLDVSPALPVFGRSPMVRQVRVTDSPFPLSDNCYQVNSHVDEAAEEFIMKFYRALNRQYDMD